VEQFWSYENRDGMQRVPGEATVTVGTSHSYSRTTRAERLMLMATTMLLPLENHFPSAGRFSALFLIFALLGIYIILNRPHILDRVWLHPVFIAIYSFLCLSVLLEATSPFSMYGDIVRFGLMACGAVFVACLCRDRLALAACMYGHIGAALWVSVILFLTSYGALSGATATNFDEANQVRVQAFRDNPVSHNLNSLAFTCTQGGVVALALALAGGSLKRSQLFLIMAVFCLLSSFLPMSRGSIGIGILSCAAVIYAHGIKKGTTWALVGVLVVSMFVLVPDAIWSRMTFSTEVHGGRMESRAGLYTTALDALPEYFIGGVGHGNFLTKWGFENGFADGRPGSYDVGEVHNCFLQILINWGLVGLIAFVVVIWQAYRYLPYPCGVDPLALGVFGIAVSLLLLTPFTHGFYFKGFSLGLGILVGARAWVWPGGIVEPVKQQDGVPSFTLL
jgi:hypothetical protein